MRYAVRYSNFFFWGGGVTLDFILFFYWKYFTIWICAIPYSSEMHTGMYLSETFLFFINFIFFSIFCLFCHFTKLSYCYKTNASYIIRNPCRAPWLAKLKWRQLKRLSFIILENAELSFFRLPSVFCLQYIREVEI